MIEKKKESINKLDSLKYEKLKKVQYVWNLINVGDGITVVGVHCLQN